MAGIPSCQARYRARLVLPAASTPSTAMRKRRHDPRAAWMASRTFRCSLVSAKVGQMLRVLFVERERRLTDRA